MDVERPLSDPALPDSSGWRVGLARTDITAWEPGMAMLGWGWISHRVHGVSERLHARAMVARDDAGGVAALVCLDLNMVPLLLREAVLERLASEHPRRGFSGHNLLLVATHTHSAPTGIGESPFYNGRNFGFSPGVFAHVLDGVVAALVQADDRCRPSTVRLGRARVPMGRAIAFNRSPGPFHRNPEARGEHLDPAQAIDREMQVLRIEDESGRDKGLVSLFGLHGTCVHDDHLELHPDHKGLAALQVEAARGAVGADPYVAIFAQGPSGDVTPNHRPGLRGRTVGVFDDDHASARFVAEVEASVAIRALEQARGAPAMTGPVGGVCRHVRPSELEVAPDHAGGRAGARVWPAGLGFGMALGTLEGPGPLGGSRELVLGWASVRRRRQLAIERLTGARASLRGDPRQVGCDLSSGIRGRLFMTASWLTLARLGLPDPTLRWLLGAWKGGLPMDRSWVSEVLPAQLLRLGPMVFAAVPGEPTTTAGRRLAAGLRASLAASGVTDVAVAPYANAYSGYITTRQEYLCQHYEGASTLYGPWTLAMWQSVFGELAAGPLCARGAVPGPATVVMSLDDLVRERELGRQALGRGAHWIAGQRLERVYT